MFQLFINIIYYASLIFLVAASFSIIYSVNNFFHFAHASIISLGAYFCLFFHSTLGIPLSSSIFLGLLFCSTFGYILNLFIFNEFKKKGASSLVLLLASLGVFLILQNTISIIWGDDTKIILTYKPGNTLEVLGGNINYSGLTTIVLVPAVILIKKYWVDSTKLGLGMKAVSQNPELAEICGINLQKIYGISFFIGSFLGGAVGLLKGFDVGVSPSLGLQLLLVGVVAVIISKNMDFLSILISSLILSFLQVFSSWFFGSKWDEAVAFTILIAYILIKVKLKKA